MKLYFAPQTRATRPLWLLEELGVPYELVKLDLSKGEHKKPEYLAIHPHGVVPTLVDEGHIFIESVAICLYLADKYADKGFAPPPGCLERGHYYQWCIYTVGTMETTLLAAFQAHKGDRQGGADEARKAFGDIARVLTKALEGREFIVAGRFTAADVLIGSALRWADVMGLLEPFPVLAGYVQRMSARPAFQRARGK